MSLSKLLHGMLTLVLMMAGLLLGAVRAEATGLQEILLRGTARIGLLIGTPPFGSVDAQGIPLGYDRDVAERIARYLGIRADYVGLTPSARIPALQGGRVDFLIATLNPTPERARSVMFSSPYGGLDMVMTSFAARRMEGWSDLDGLRIGATRGSPQEAAVRRAGALSITLYEDDMSVANALVSGQIDAAPLPDAMVRWLARQAPPTRLNVGFRLYAQVNAMAVRPGNFELLQWLNTTISAMRRSGELDALYRKWFDMPLPQLDGL
ncbi:transporter substrate-binding domain-containing protein [Xanthobacteraceae bacterium A53D]